LSIRRYSGLAETEPARDYINRPFLSIGVYR